MNDMITYEAPLLRGRFIVFGQRPDFELLKVKQTHSNIVVDEDQCNVEIVADGILGRNSTPKAILTADCVPLVLIGKDQHVVIHAGWRGLAQNILNHKLVQEIAPTYAFIGPHIRAAHYEVQNDFLQNFTTFPQSFSTRDNKMYFNLASVAQAQLKTAYSNIVIEDCGLCTFNDPKFHSYRRDQTIQRNWNVYFPN